MGKEVSSKESFEAKVDLQVLESQLSNRQKNMLSEDTIEELKKLSEDPDYGQEFLDCYKDHLNILNDNPKYTSKNYLCAIKFFSLIEAGNSITDAYIKVFPERFKRRLDRGQKKEDITGEASRYNATALVNDIRKVAGIPVNLIHRHLLHESILEQANLMRTARSELVRQKASACLIAELKPTEDHVLNVKVEDGAKSAIQALHEATEKLVLKEQNSIKSGVPIKDIIEAKIVHPQKEEFDDSE